jgi:hypothetical protein
VASMANAASKYFRVIANGWWSADATTYIARRLPQIPTLRTSGTRRWRIRGGRGSLDLIIC